MHRISLFAMLVLFSQAARPDGDLRFVRLECRTELDELRVSYLSEYKQFQPGDVFWDTFDLKENFPDKDYVKSLHPVTQKCSLASGEYLVEIRPVPGNWNLNGECGGVTFAGVKIVLGNRTLVDLNFEECHADELISAVRVTKRAEVHVEKVGADEFWGLQ